MEPGRDQNNLAALTSGRAPTPASASTNTTPNTSNPQIFPPQLIPSPIEGTVDTWLKLGPKQSPLGVAIAPDGSKLAISVEGKAEYFILIYHPRTKQLLHKIGGTSGATNGNFAEAKFNYAMGMDWSQDSKTLFIADYGNHFIRKADFATGTVSTLCGGAEGFRDGPLDQAQFNCPTDVKIDPLSDTDEPRIYVTEYYNHSLRCIDIAKDSVSSLIGDASLRSSLHGFKSQPAQAAQRLVNPTGVAVRADGSLFIADFGNDRIVRFDVNSKEISNVAGIPKMGGSRDGIAAMSLLRSPTCMCFIPQTKDIIWCDYGRHAVRMIEDVDSTLPLVYTLANTSATRGVVDGRAWESQFEYPRAPAILPPRIDHDLEGYTIFITEYRGAIRRLQIHPKAAQAYHLRRARAHRFNLEQLFGSNALTDLTIHVADGAKRRAHSAIIRARCPALVRIVSESSFVASSSAASSNSSLSASTAPHHAPISAQHLDWLLEYIYCDRLPISTAQFPQNLAQLQGELSTLVELIGLGKRFEVAPLVNFARGRLATLIMRLSPQLIASDALVAILQKLTESFGCADEMSLLEGLRQKPGPSNPNAALFAAIPTGTTRHDITNLIDHDNLVKHADISLIFTASAGEDVVSTDSFVEVRVHSAILFARSTYFRGLLSGKFRANNHQLTMEVGPLGLSIPDLDIMAFLHSLVGIIYGHKNYVPKTIEEAFLLLDRLHFYGIDDEAAERAQEVILHHLNVHNCVSVLSNVIDIPELELVRRTALGLISSNLKMLYPILEKEADSKLLLKVLLFKATYEPSNSL